MIHDDASGRWRMWGTGMTRLDKSDEGCGLCAYESSDGFGWQPLRQDPPVDALFEEEGCEAPKITTL